MPDCCEQCCDCEKPDPIKDRVCIKAPITKQENGCATENPLLFTGDPVKPHLLEGDGDEVKRKELQEAKRFLEEVALMEKQRQDEDARQLRKAQEVAEAAEVREAVEARDLWEAQQASLREHESMQQKQRDEEKIQRYEEQLMTEKSMKEQRLKEEKEDQLKVDAFLKLKGFADIDAKRKSMFMRSTRFIAQCRKTMQRWCSFF